MQLYKAYVFKKHEQDPVIDHLKTIVEDEGLSNSELSVKSGVSTSTMYNWWEKQKTKRPQFCTIMAVARACSYDVQFVKHKNGHDLSAASAISISKRRYG